MAFVATAKPKRVALPSTARRTAKPAIPHRAVDSRSVLQVIQPKLKVSEADDQFEKEANRVAEIVTRSAPSVSAVSDGAHEIRRKCADCSTGQGTCHNCQTEEKDIQRKPWDHKAAFACGDRRDLAADVGRLKGSGRPLPQPVRAAFEPRFGHDFSQVRIHTDPGADRLANALGARAFTLGNDIAFESGQFSPGSTSGKRLLAHELTHVVQQGATSSITSRSSKSTSTIQRFSEPDCKKVCKQGCSKVEEDFKRAKTLIDKAIEEMSKKELSGQTRTALRWLFYLENDSKNSYLLNILKVMREALVRADNNTDVQCEKDCDSDYTETPKKIAPGVLQQCTAEIPCTIHLCPPHFDLAPSDRAISLLHEAGHLAGLSGETYIHEADFRFLSQESALVNAEHFAMFIRALNGTLKSDLRTSIGAVGGLARSGGTFGWYVSGMFDLTLNRPVWRVFNPTLRFSLTGYGVEGSGRDERLEDPNNKVAIASVLAGARFGQSRGPGGAFFDAMAGVGRAFGRDESKFVFTASANLGYRWDRTEFALGASYIRDTTAAKGYENVFLVGASVNFNFFDLIGK